MHNPWLILPIGAQTSTRSNHRAPVLTFQLAHIGGFQDEDIAGIGHPPVRRGAHSLILPAHWPATPSGTGPAIRLPAPASANDFRVAAGRGRADVWLKLDADWRGLRLWLQ
jgi:hypothetical protein